MNTSVKLSRIPLPVESALGRMNLNQPSTSVEEALDRVVTNRRILQDFKPIDESLEAELSNLCWQDSGLLLFVENDVPYAINNTSQLSDRVAEVLFASCLDSPPPDRLNVLELGAGTGLFARFLLDAFKLKCQKEGRDFYDRLTFYVSDRSPSTVQQWSERGLFTDHEAHVVTGTCDALTPSRLTLQDGSIQTIQGIRAAFFNYLCDTLPSKVIRRGENGCEEMWVRTHLTDDADRVKRYTDMPIEEMRALAASRDAADKAKLSPLVCLFDFETTYRANGTLPPYAHEALTVGIGAERVVVNHGAIRCLEECHKLLDDAGFLLVNDYGPVQVEQISKQSVTQRFGRTTASGVNFPLLQHHFSKAGCVVVKADGDDERPIHTRLFLKSRQTLTVETFQRQFSLEEHQASERPIEEARKHVEARRLDEALASYKAALARHPRDWRLLGELADCLIRALSDYQTSLEVARTAVRLNPWYSPWLWNVLGDSLYAQDRFQEAHEAYLQASRIDPNDVRTNLNLAYTYTGFGKYGEALESIARGLAMDGNAVFREKLLEKQQNVLQAISAKWTSEQDWLNRRSGRLSS